MSFRSRAWWGSAVAALAIAAAACTEGTAPTLSNPQQLDSDLQAVDAVFQSPVFLSFSAVSESLGTAAASLAPAGALLRATRPAAPPAPGQPYTDSPRRVQALRYLTTAMSPAATTGVIPDTLWGKTYGWDPATHHYVEDPGQFDANRQGVRFILYAVNPITKQIIENPLIPVGYVDLLDESSGSTNQLHVIVVGTISNPSVTYADYTISATVTGDPPTAFDASANGFVSDGPHTLTFNASFAITNANTDNPDASLSVDLTLNNPAFSVHLVESITTPDANNATLSMNLSVTHGGETVALSGTVTAVKSPKTVTADLTVTINGGIFARITGTNTDTNEGIQIVHADGTPLSPDELPALRHLFKVPDEILEVIEHLFHPAENFLHV